VAAFAIAHGTVWSFWPSTIGRGLRAGFSTFTFRLGPAVEVRVAHLHERDARAGDVERVVELLRLLVVQRIRPGVRELVDRERDRAAARERVDQERATLSTDGDRGRTPRNTPGSIATVTYDFAEPGMPVRVIARS
jgi:hypothetical protein